MAETNQSGRWIYDIEIYPNLFLLGAKIPYTDTRRSFQISPLADDRQELAQWLLNDVVDMVGYNNLSYDSPVLYKLVHNYMNVQGRVAVAKLFEYSKRLVRSNRYPPRIHPVRPQIDVFKINHFDNKAKMTSLKLLEFNLREKHLQSLPYPFDMVLSKEQIWEVVSYNDNDVDATEKVYRETESEIVLREKMSPVYGIDFTNYNSSKMGEHILISKITEKLGKETLYHKIPTADGDHTWKVRNTKRDEIDLGEVVFDYIKFDTEPFQKVTKWLKSRKIKETKGAFTRIPFEELKDLEPHYVYDKEKGKQKNLNVLYRGLRYDFGTGGIHGCIEPGVYEADERKIIRDIDVASYYPNLAIKNDFYPEHIGPEFCPVYEGIYIERQNYPKKTHKAENLALKLALNGSYGKSNSEYSPLYDPKYTMLTTVNGQLLLCMLAEQLMERVPGCQMLQINTDGLTIKFDKVYNKLVDNICREWERLTKLTLEDAYYSQMIIKDVNNYIGVFEDGSVKRKGAAFIHRQQPGELELHKNFSQLVVPKALEAYFVDGVLPEDFFREHDDVYDFFKRTKVPRSSRLEAREYDAEANVVRSSVEQNISRYLVTGKYRLNKETKRYEKTGYGDTLIKIMPPLKGREEKGEREFNVEAGWLCTVVNTLPDNLDSLRQVIDYDYYVEQAYDVINLITGNESKQS